MKKLMILAAVAVAAVAANAATIKWTTGAIKLPGEGGAQTGSQMTMSNVAGIYVWSLTEAISGDVLAGVTTFNDGTGVYTLKTGSVSPTTLSKGSATVEGSISQYSKNDTAYAAALIYIDTDGSGTFNKGDMYIAAQGSFTLDADTSKSIPLGMEKVNWAAAPGGTTPTPEPTSGLLLVLGMAGLALKRKIA